MLILDLITPSHNIYTFTHIYARTQMDANKGPTERPTRSFHLKSMMFTVTWKRQKRIVSNNLKWRKQCVVYGIRCTSMTEFIFFGYSKRERERENQSIRSRIEQQDKLLTKRRAIMEKKCTNGKQKTTEPINKIHFFTAFIRIDCWMLRCVHLNHILKYHTNDNKSNCTQTFKTRIIQNH